MDNFEVVRFEDNGSLLLYSEQFIGHLGYCLFSLQFNMLNYLTNVFLEMKATVIRFLFLG